MKLLSFLQKLTQIMYLNFFFLTCCSRVRIWISMLLVLQLGL